MREIKFRGLRVDGKGWVYGVPFRIDGEPKCFIINNCRSLHLTQEDSVFFGIEIIPETVGQYTGLKDKNGKEIYEGDIFRQEIGHDYGDSRIYNVVTWIKERGAFYMIDVCHYDIYMNEKNKLEEDPDFDWLFEHADLYDFSIDVGFDLVGNVHQNKELLKTKQW